MTIAAHFTLHLRRFDEEMQFLAGDTIVDNSVRQLGADHQTKWRRWVAGPKKKANLNKFVISFCACVLEWKVSLSIRFRE